MGAREDPAVDGHRSVRLVAVGMLAALGAQIWTFWMRPHNRARMAMTLSPLAGRCALAVIGEM